MTLQQLKYVCMVEKYGSFTKAAQKLFVSQPGISNLIHSLEDELGITIFIRSPLGVTITEEGRELIKMANKLLNDADYIDDYFKNNNKATSKVSFFVSSQHYDFVVSAYEDFLKNINKTHDSFTLGINQTTTANVINDVRQQRSSLGILYIASTDRKHMERTLADNNLQFHLLTTTKPHAFMSKKHPLAGKESITTENLMDYPCITYTQNDDSPAFYSEEILLPDFYPEKVVYISDLYLSWHFMSNCDAYDIGTGIINDKLARDITYVPIQSASTIDIGYIKLKGHTLDDIEKKFLKYLKKKMRLS